MIKPRLLESLIKRRRRCRKVFVEVGAMSEKICDLPKGYVPSEDEEFMNDFQREYFRRKLEKWKEELLQENDESLKAMQEESEFDGDDVDRASTETTLGYEIRTKERARKLIAKIDNALLRIKNGTYGFCEETGEPIDLKRLEVRPNATLSLKAQERHERQEKIQR